ncbi:flagellar hook-associated protein FlgL [Alteromonas sp. 1_MG-2023]|uniref:flagellar hook-associated protein FlgL n=1 Tax=Alteromonas sp. 1_MG-2023 TaxID=3062669 RepID=UPI0026E32651|nr:flagellar hook-associated protein FlgL [Alteromonas sp. 1_MG-2023]MDO6476510.1 flagellar hook-associated protein FlgL [Alteromonas sp. 1_MG-2023]
MRISTNQIYDQNIRAIMDNQKGLADTQEALATGKKLNRPSDDPVGAAKVIRITEQLDKLTQYQRNNDLLTNALEQQEAVLTNINDSLNRARTLVVQAGSGIMTDEDKRAIGVELEQIRNEVFDLMNTQDAAGNYIFAGYQSQQQAFTFNPAATGNAIFYTGDSGATSVRLSDSVTVQRSSSGQEVFENVLSRFDFTVTGSAGATVQTAKVGEQGTFDQFYEKNYDPVTAANNNYQLTVLGTGQVQLTNTGTGAVEGTVDFTSGEPFTIKGMAFTLDGTTGDTVNFSLDTPVKKNVAETLNDIANQLINDSLSGDALTDALGDALVGLDNGMERINLERSSLGGRMNVAESIYETNLDLEITAKDARAQIEETDYAEASAEFAKQEAALSAALATFPKVSNLSLFNYIS